MRKALSPTGKPQDQFREHRELLEAFKAFDRDNRGSICPEELHQALRALDKAYPDAEISEMMAQLIEMSSWSLSSLVLSSESSSSSLFISLPSASRPRVAPDTRESRLGGWAIFASFDPAIKAALATGSLDLIDEVGLLLAADDAVGLDLQLRVAVHDQKSVRFAR